MRAGLIWLKQQFLNQIEDVNSLIKEFTPGVSEYFLSSLGVIFNVIIVSLVILVAASIIGMKVIGNPDISIEALNAAVQTPESLKVFLASLSKRTTG